MNDELKKAFQRQNAGDEFIKVTDLPNKPLTSEQKVQLNRKGNVLFNSGDIIGALKIYKATGYSDGLVRAGDKFAEQGKEIDALKLYYLAHSKIKTEYVSSKLAQLISSVMQERTE
ncbi:MAG: hypothetical protein ACRC4W_01890 [Treponemataceae bacterium]